MTADPDITAALRAPSLLGCPFCGKHPHHGLTKKQFCQLHGEPFQHYQVRCPSGHATITEGNKENAFRMWNSRQPPPSPTVESSP